MLDCDQQIPRYLTVLGLLWVQLQVWVMRQPQLPNCCILHLVWVMNCFHTILFMGYYVGLCMSRPKWVVARKANVGWRRVKVDQS